MEYVLEDVPPRYRLRDSYLFMGEKGTRVRSISNNSHVTSNATWDGVKGREKESIRLSTWISLHQWLLSYSLLTYGGDRSLRRLKGHNTFSKRTQWFFSLSLCFSRDFQERERERGGLLSMREKVRRSICYRVSRPTKWGLFRQRGNKTWMGMWVNAGENTYSRISIKAVIPVRNLCNVI